jgi:hypothetical protein
MADALASVIMVCRRRVDRREWRRSRRTTSEAEETKTVMNSQLQQHWRALIFVNASAL